MLILYEEIIERGDTHPMKLGVAGPVNLTGPEIRRRLPLLEDAGLDSIWFYEVSLHWTDSLTAAAY